MSSPVDITAFLTINEAAIFKASGERVENVVRLQNPITQPTHET